MSEPVGGKSKGKGLPLHTKILLGLLVGAVLGILANTQLGGEHPFVLFAEKYVANPVGQIFLNLLFMIVIPLVFASIALGVAGLGDLKQVGRVGSKTLGYFLVTTVLSATLGLFAVRFFARRFAGFFATLRRFLLRFFIDVFLTDAMGSLRCRDRRR